MSHTFYAICEKHILVTSNIAFNVSDGTNSKFPQSQIKIPTPTKETTPTKKLVKKFLNDGFIVSKFAENVAENYTKVYTPAKETDVSQVIGEGSQNLNTFAQAEVESFLNEPYLDQFLQDFLQCMWFFFGA